MLFLSLFLGQTIGPILFNKNTTIEDLKKTVCNIRLSKQLSGDSTNILGIIIINISNFILIVIIGVLHEKIGTYKDTEIYLSDDSVLWYLLNKGKIIIDCC